MVNKPKANVEHEEDRELKDELQTYVAKITSSNASEIAQALDMLRFVIRTHTTSMTAVPKPLKYMAPHFGTMKEAYAKIKNQQVQKQCAEIISILAMAVAAEDKAKEQRDCLKYCLLGTMQNIGDWGHEYVRQLENELVEQWIISPKTTKELKSLVNDILKFDCKYHAEIQACDMLMEIDKLDLLPEYIDQSLYKRVCLYLTSCAKYVDDVEAQKIYSLVLQQYLKYGENARALMIAMLMNDGKMVQKIFLGCKDTTLCRQLAFIAARQLFPVELPENMPDRDELHSILSNSQLSSYFQKLARELDILEPKSPEDVYKNWLEPTPIRPSIIGENIDSARQNLAASFVNGFVNAGFGSDKLLTLENGNKWIFRNKDHAMVSVAASLGLVYLWDVDGGLTPIDKYLYASDVHIKSGALMAIGIVNCRVRYECDPPLALLAEYLTNESYSLRMGASFGLGIAYAGTARKDVLKLLIPTLEKAVMSEEVAVTSLACGLVAVGSCDGNVSNAILGKLVDARDTDLLKSSYARLIVLGLGLCYMGRKTAIETPCAALEVFAEPFKTISETILQMCAYAGTGDVLVVQKLLHAVSERIVLPEKKSTEKKELQGDKPITEPEKKKPKRKWDPSIAQAVAGVAVAAVSIGEQMGTEMCQRILGHMGRYGDPAVRRATPLAIALTSVSNPLLSIIDILTKYAHDSDEEVSSNAIFCLGIVGAGTNNARLAAGLRQLAVYHMRNSPHLFMVRLAQGLVHLGKGTLTLSPLHSDRQLLDSCAMAGLLIPLTMLLDTHTLLLGRTHYLIYSLVVAMQPRWLLALDESLEPVSASVRIGQAVDTVAKAGNPNTIAGIHTHSTPVLLSSGERAELATDLFEQLNPTLDGICILKKKEGVAQ